MAHRKWSAEYLVSLEGPGITNDEVNVKERTYHERVSVGDTYDAAFPAVFSQMLHFVKGQHAWLKRMASHTLDRCPDTNGKGNYVGRPYQGALFAGEEC